MAKAVLIIDQMDPRQAKSYYRRIAQHYYDIKDYDNAEKYFIAGGLPNEAVTMYTNVNMWDKARKLASAYMPPNEVTLLYVTRAQQLEADGKFKGAECLYFTVNEPVLAIAMYKKNRQYEDMVRTLRVCCLHVAAYGRRCGLLLSPQCPACVEADAAPGQWQS